MASEPGEDLVDGVVPAAVKKQNVARFRNGPQLSILCRSEKSEFGGSVGNRKENASVSEQEQHWGRDRAHDATGWSAYDRDDLPRGSWVGTPGFLGYDRGVCFGRIVEEVGSIPGIRGARRRACEHPGILEPAAFSYGPAAGVYWRIPARVRARGHG